MPGRAKLGDGRRGFGFDRIADRDEPGEPRRRPRSRPASGPSAASAAARRRAAPGSMPRSRSRRAVPTIDPPAVDGPATPRPAIALEARRPRGSRARPRAPGRRSPRRADARCRPRARRRGRAARRRGPARRRDDLADRRSAQRSACRSCRRRRCRPGGRASSASPPRMRIPASAPRPVPTMIAVGVARPIAHGQAMITTADERGQREGQARLGAEQRTRRRTSAAATTRTAGHEDLADPVGEALDRRLASPGRARRGRRSGPARCRAPTRVARKDERAGRVERRPDDLVAGRLRDRASARR